MLKKINNNSGYYTKTAAVLTVILIILTIIFAKKYLRLFNKMSTLRSKTKLYLNTVTNKDKSLNLNLPTGKHNMDGMNRILINQKLAIRGINKKNELIVANWNKKFKKLHKKSELEIKDLKEQLDFFITLYTYKLESLSDLVNELLPAQGVEKKMAAGDLLLTLEQYDLSLHHYSEALDQMDEAGFDEAKKKSFTVKIHQRIATTILIIHKTNIKDADPTLLEQALDHLQTALKLDSENPESYYIQANILYLTGADTEEIIESLKQALAGKEIPIEKLIDEFKNLKDDASFKEFLGTLNKK